MSKDKTLRTDLTKELSLFAQALMAQEDNRNVIAEAKQALSKAQEYLTPRHGKEQENKDMDEYGFDVDTSHKYTDVVCKPEIGPGGAHHHYEIRKKEGAPLLRFSFQDGPIKEAGINGVMDENFIAIVIDRLEGFQAGKYASSYNRLALEHLKAALIHLQQRTAEREHRGVEGTHKV